MAEKKRPPFPRKGIQERRVLEKMARDAGIAAGVEIPPSGLDKARTALVKFKQKLQKMKARRQPTGNKERREFHKLTGKFNAEGAIQKLIDENPELFTKEPYEPGFSPADLTDPTRLKTIERMEPELFKELGTLTSTGKAKKSDPRMREDFGTLLA